MKTIPASMAFRTVALFIVGVIALGSARSMSAQAWSSGPPPAGTFTSVDVGAVGAAGSTSISDAAITVRGAGEDIYGPNDEFHYFYRNWTGDGMFVVRVKDVQYTFNWAKAGIMLRSSLASNAQHVTGFISPERNTALIHRPVDGGFTTGAEAGPDSDKAMPMWLKLIRQGGTVSLFFSPDGNSWRSRGSVSVALPQSVLVGLVVCSHVDATLSTANFDHFSLGPVVPTQLQAVAHAPNRVDLKWVDNALNETGYEVERSSNAVTFTRVGTAAANATAFSDPTVSPSSTYHYRVRSIAAGGPSEYSNALSVTTPPPSPAGWSSLDVGDTSIGGRSTESGGVFTIVGSGEGVGGVRYVRPSTGRGDVGADVPGYSDEFQYCWKPWSGDGEMIARLTGLSGAYTGHAGIMVRVNEGISAYNVFLYLEPDGALGVTARPGTSTNFLTEYRNQTFPVYSASGVARPHWLKLVRSGGGVMCYSSVDGVNWSERAWVTTPLTPDVQFGFAVSSRQDGDPPALPAVLTGTFDNVAIRAVSTPPLPPVPPSGLQATQVLQTHITLEWTNPQNTYDGIEVQRSTDGANFSVLGRTASTLWSNSGVEADTMYHYRLRTIRGTTTSSFSEVLSVRTLAYPAPPSNLVATATSASQIVLTWIDNSDNENGFFLEQSTDNVNFVWIASPQRDSTSYTVDGLTAGTTYYFRLLVYPYGPRIYSNTASATPAAPPTGGSWQSGDIGAVAAPGSSSESGGVVTMRASGADIWNTADEFHYRYQAWSGDGTITARVTGLTNTDGWAKAGVMFRESLAANSRHAMMIVSVAHGTAFQYRSAAGGQSGSSTPSGTGTLPRYVRLVRAGSTFTGYVSTDGSNWTQAGTLTLTGMPATIYVGLAATSHNDGVLTTATFDQVQLAGASAPVPPSLAAPSNLAVAGVTATQIELSWNDNSSDETGFTIERSTNGTNFTELITVGANVRGFVNTGLSPATTYWYRAYARRDATVSGYSNTVNATTSASSSPPGGWTAQDIGAVASAGSSSESGGTVTVTGSGADIWNTADEFQFRHQAWSGDGEIIARVTGLTNTDGWAKAGVMFRESLTAGSRHAFMCVSIAHGTALQYRTTTGGQSGSTAPSQTGGVQQWLRLVRSGNTFTGYASLDGATWTQAGSITLALPTSIYVGLAVTSHNDGVLATATFQNVSVTGGGTPPATPPNPPTSLAAKAISASQIDLTWTDNSNNESGFEVESSTNNTTFTRLTTTTANVTAHAHTGLSGSTTYYYRVRAVNAAGVSSYTAAVSATTPAATTPPPTTGTWTSRDIGAVAAAGHTDETATGVLLTGSGADIWNTADEFRYRYQAWTGDGEIITRVTTLTNTHGWAKAGVMFRETLEPNSRHAFMCVSIAHGTAFQYRAATGGESGSSVPSESGGVPRWLRLVRSGNTFTGHASADGTHWQQAGTFTLALPATIYVGTAVTSHNDGVLCTATFENTSLVAGGGSPPPPPPPSSSWEFGDIGTVGVAGSNTSDGNTITVNGSGADIWNTGDGFRFVYRTMTGDCMVEARVSSLTNTHSWAKAGVMIRDGTAANARNVFAFMTPANGVVAQHRAATGGTTVATNGPWWVRAPYWVRLVRTGSRITAFSSADGTSWAEFAAYNVTVGASVQVGFAVTSHDNTQLATAVFTDPFVQ